MGARPAPTAPEARASDVETGERRLRADAIRNRQLVLAAAGAAFAEEGADVPLEVIAKRAGVGIGTLYRHFPTREALVEAVYRREVEVLSQRADELLAELPPDQALAEWMQLFVQHVATKRGMLSVLKPLMASNSSLSDATRGVAVNAASRLLAAGVAAGTVRDDIEGADLVRAVGGICLSTDQEHAAASDRLVRVLVDGLKSERAAAAD